MTWTNWSNFEIMVFVPPNVCFFCLQVTNHPEPGVGPEEKGVCGAGPELLDAEEAVQERAPAHQAPPDEPAVSEECTAGLFICQSKRRRLPSLDFAFSFSFTIQ